MSCLIIFALSMVWNIAGSDMALKCWSDALITNAARKCTSHIYAGTEEEVALRYKELWQVEHVFRDMKSVLETRPIVHQRDDTIRGHVFCSFLALVLRKELQCRVEEAGYDFEWSDIVQDLEALQETIIEENGKSLVVRTECQGTCGKVFQAVGVAVPPTIRDVTANT